MLRCDTCFDPLEVVGDQVALFCERLGDAVQKTPVLGEQALCPMIILREPVGYDLLQGIVIAIRCGIPTVKQIEAEDHLIGHQIPDDLLSIIKVALTADPLHSSGRKSGWQAQVPHRCLL